MRQLNALFSEAFGEARNLWGRTAGRRLFAAIGSASLTSWSSRRCEGGAVIGGLVAYELEKFERRRSEFYIYDLAVDASHRRRGVASACIERLRAIAAERGACTIFVQADYGDEAAIALYQKKGVSGET